MIPSTTYLRLEKTGAVIVDIHVIPNASRTQADGEHDGALRVRLHAPPVDGKANLALAAWLADALGIAKRDVELIRGGFADQTAPANKDIAATTAASPPFVPRSPSRRGAAPRTSS